MIFALGLAVAVLTPFYMGRLYLLAFGGTARSDGAAHAHEAPWTMTVPLAVLALLSLSAGWLPMGEYIGLHAGPEAHGVAHAGAGIHWGIALPATGAALLGLGLAWLLYSGDPARRADRRQALFSALGPLGRAIDARFWIDEAWLFVTHRIVFRLVAAPIAWFDRTVVDGGVNLTGWLTRAGGATLTHLQNGQVQAYATWLTSGAAALALVLWALLGRV